MLKCIRGNLGLNYTDFKNGLDNGKQFPIYLFEGEDAFFRERGLALLKNKFVQEPSLNYAVFNGEVSENDLLSSLSAFPFMSECRMTVIREYYPKQNSISKGIKEYFSNPIDNSILVIVNQKSCDVLKNAIQESTHGTSLHGFDPNYISSIGAKV